MNNTTFLSWLEEHNACDPAVTWVGGRTPYQAWADCHCADWMLWGVAHAHPDESLKPAIVKLARGFAASAASAAGAGCAAEHAAHAACAAAYAACAAADAACAAADAATYAAYAADAARAASVARDAAHAEMADEVRKAIPWGALRLPEGQTDE